MAAGANGPTQRLGLGSHDRQSHCGDDRELPGYARYQGPPLWLDHCVCVCVCVSVCVSSV